jgi:hypothetical protein
MKQKVMCFIFYTVCHVGMGYIQTLMSSLFCVKQEIN